MLRSVEGFHYDASVPIPKKNASKPAFGDAKNKQPSPNQDSTLNLQIQDVFQRHKHEISDASIGLHYALTSGVDALHKTLKKIPPDDHMNKAGAYDALEKLYIAAAVTTEPDIKNYEKLRMNEMKIAGLVP